MDLLKEAATYTAAYKIENKIPIDGNEILTLESMYDLDIPKNAVLSRASMHNANVLRDRLSIVVGSESVSAKRIFIKSAHSLIDTIVFIRKNLPDIKDNNIGYDVALKIDKVMPSYGDDGLDVNLNNFIWKCEDIINSIELLNGSNSTITGVKKLYNNSANATISLLHALIDGNFTYDNIDNFIISEHTYKDLIEALNNGSIIKQLDTTEVKIRKLISNVESSKSYYAITGYNRIRKLLGAYDLKSVTILASLKLVINKDW